MTLRSPSIAAKAEAEAALADVLLQIYLAFLSLEMLVDPTGKQDAVDSSSIVSGYARAFPWSLTLCFKGRFEHLQHPVLEARKPSRAQDSIDGGPGVPSLARLDVLSKIIGSPSTDALFELISSPKTFNETQQDLRRYLRDSYLRFERPRDVYLFMKLVSFSNDFYGNWVGVWSCCEWLNC